MKKVVLLLIAFISVTVYAQTLKQPDTYNYNRGMEAFTNENYQEALDYFNKELVDNPKNGYAFVWIAIIRNDMSEYGRALTAVDMGIKYLPKKEAKFSAIAYSCRSSIYANLSEVDKSINDISMAIKIDPGESRYYEDRANLYYQIGEYDLSDKDCQKLIDLDKGSVMGYMLMGRNANKEERYEDAIKQFDYVIKMHPDYSSGYSFRAESYINLKQYSEAIDDIITALYLDGDDKAFSQMIYIAEDAFTPLITKLKIQIAKNPAQSVWLYYVAAIYERNYRYKEAIDFYKQCMEVDASPLVAYRISSCLNDLGYYDQALEYCNKAIALNPDGDNYILLRANINNDAGKTKEAIADMDIYISKQPEFYFGYYRRGWFKDHSGDLDGALEDYSIALTLEPHEYPYAYLNRGIIYNLQGIKEKAVKDLERVVELDTVPGDNSCKQYAYYYLGKKEKAIEWLEVILSQNDNKGNNYDAACLYSIMGESEKALFYLQKSLEKGFRRFAHIHRDRDLNNIRELTEFKKLLNDYEEQHKEEQSILMDDDEEYIEKVTEIPFIIEGGVYRVKCDINDLPMYFIFDTGASDVSMSTVEATFMLKNNYLSPQDIIGKQNYMTATGEITEGTIINLRNVSFGELDLSNIKASIVKTQKAPLLLGQSVLNKLGTINIDNQKKVIKVTYKERK